MKFVTSEAMRTAEGRAIAKAGALALGMMDRAGEGLARAVQQIAVHLGRPAAAVRLLAGPGNNGGDAFAAALHLRAAGLAPEVWLTCPREKLRGAAKTFFEEMAAGPVPWREMVGERVWRTEAETTLSPPILVDALLGIGAKGEPMGDIRRGVNYLNSKASYSLIVAADVPTGLDADTGAAGECVVTADVTVAMCLPKTGLAEAAALEKVGSLILVPIGIPREYVEGLPAARPDLQLITGLDVRDWLPRRRRDSHKGTYGVAQLLGGSARYPGAIVLAAEGAARSGAGLLRVATVPDAVAPLVARVPEAVVHAGLGPEMVLEPADAILLGPGLGRGPESRRLVERILRETSGPLVLDADALAVRAGEPEIIRPGARPVILTPHPGELALLLGTDVATIQRDRLAAVRAAAARTGAIVALKGAGTLVAQASGPAWLNLNGNPGMACGGSGDVLAGLLTGLLARPLPPFEAACAAVYLHGLAGDFAAWRQTQAGLKAGDIAAALPEAFHVIAPR